MEIVPKNKPDLDEETFKKAKDTFVQNFMKTVEERKDIEKRTILQSESVNSLKFWENRKKKTDKYLQKCKEPIRHNKMHFYKKNKNGEVVINQKSDWYFQVQGQLHICKKNNVCLGYGMATIK
ncbi:tRNA-specific adenosine-34 deaminase subunit [Operophtera brumata]|uniref:tRNA-specific adenosine-34 deaminase subunit n=1 Tax=Operophtera brumata TaxID=104452 RepID=A0A0L7LQ30_OPEBR|nr:tRNA-specific adenosine-34 deaminase subunit [Operophtera brumata]